ncbi:MAG: DNA mismatch endonuclease Vsr [Muribaculaceae bacterium]|nr:DNA mismatch endonuclease Vsr [Muribaculaceae bacterium]MBR5118265.1 DNA mismatch endonuclease Vsr [Muribaculaceae bacterium]
MADKMTPEQRHHCMSRIHSRDTKPEMIVRRWLWSQGYRYRLNVKQLPGRPDIVLTRFSTVIFVNGCFWHAHDGCDKYRIPLTNVDFWTEKFRRNRERDERNYRLLHKMGWYVLVVWECQLTKENRSATLLALSHRLSQIFLEAKGAKLYPSPEEETIPIAAEPKVEYGK